MITTYDVFSHTWDEPGHIAGGIEWLTKGTYQVDQQHPPLTRIAFGLAPAFIGVQPPGPTPPGDDWMFIESRKILYDSNQYQRALFWPRMGNLPFFWIGCLVVFLWGKRYFGLGAGVFALFLFSFLPPVLAHSGLATTDLGCTAMLGAAFLTACILIEEPSRSHAAVLRSVRRTRNSFEVLGPRFFSSQHCRRSDLVWSGGARTDVPDFASGEDSCAIARDFGGRGLSDRLGGLSILFWPCLRQHCGTASARWPAITRGDTQAT
jgi:hypothetical protein